MTTHTIRFAVSDTVSLVADCRGPEDGAPVLLLHGGGQTRWSWGRTAQALAEVGLRVHALDLRGHGESDWCPDGEYTLDHFADDLRQVIEQFSMPPVVVGASLGGLSSLLACGEGPMSACAALVLVDISPRIEAGGSNRVTDFLRSTVDGFDSLEAAAAAVAAYAPNRKRSGRPEGLLKNLRQDADGRYRWHWDPAFVIPKEGAPEWDLAELEGRLMDAAHRITAPTLIVRGDQSDVVSEQTMAHLAAALPHVEQAVIVGAGHMIAGDANAAFNAAILPFVLRHCGA